ncbi:hypothetical protein [Pseudomonas citronellolis]|uniref:hypothetical protein n=1 Tax=Pseudomonas citronellolis TaxID=53408 RepID=UPI0023E46982|nr:hypothetical protein [Pseudomonas citronellolis]MDF3932956.1 hypothetical protein [Pseudomonas citronellolis]
MSSQQFHERVDQVAAGDIKNFIEAPRPEQPVLLSSAQRQVLNALVEEIAKECEKEPRFVWREVVHARVGVDSINEILRDSFHDAQDALVCYRDNHRRQANIRLMVARITNLTKEKGIYNERDAWCLRQFGEKHLNAMGTEQLRLVLAFVEDFLIAPAQEQPAPAVSEPIARQGLGFLSGLKEFVTTYPMHCGAIALVLMILGKIV